MAGRGGLEGLPLARAISWREVVPDDWRWIGAGAGLVVRGGAPAGAIY